MEDPGWWLWSLKRGRGRVVLNSAGGAGAATVVAVAMDGWVLRMYGGGPWRRLFFMTMIQGDQGGGLGGVALLSHSRGLFGGDWRMMEESLVKHS
jgi:hypothetical protein